MEWAKVNDDSLLKYKDPDISKTAVKAAIEAGREIPYAAVVRRPTDHKIRREREWDLQYLY